MPALALDIGTHSIKAISGKPGSTPVIERLVEANNELSIAVPTDDAQTEKLAQALQVVISDNKLPVDDIRLSLPETVVSTKIISLPWLSDAELASAIGWQAEQHIPIPPEELSLEYQVLYRPPRSEKTEQMRVLLIGVRKQVIERYMNVFALLGTEPTLLETQTLSVMRSLQFGADEPPTLMVHLGAATMNMAVVAQGELTFVFTHLNGGALLTKVLEQGASLSPEQAEQYKRAYGLDEAHFQGKVRAVLDPAVKMLVTEMQKAARFQVTQRPNQPVQRVILSGGSAQLPGLVEYLAAEMGVEVLVAAPFAAAKGQVPAANNPAMAVCMGLMMRALK